MTTLYPQVSLYIATHNITGIKYFGKTTKYLTEDLLQQKYHGSGSDWKEHLSKHSDNVTMKLIGVYSLNPDDNNYVEPIALKLSEEWNIVESDNWANRKLENGLDGGWRGYSKTDDELLLSRQKELETKSSKEWQENVWKPAMEKRAELINSKEWKQSKGVEKLKNMESHYLANCKHYDLINALTNKVIKYDITPRDFCNWSGALINTSKENYLGFSNRSKSKMIRDGKEKYIGLYIKERI